MLRNVGAVFLGLLVGSAVNMAIILLNLALFPMPEGSSMEDPEQMNAYVATLPAVAFLVVWAAHLGQSFVGGWVAARVGASHPMRLALIVGAFSFLGGVLNMQTIHGPPWFALELPMYFVVAWAAGRLEQRRRAGG